MSTESLQQSNQKPKLLSENHQSKIEFSPVPKTFQEFILATPVRHLGLYSKDNGFLLDPRPRYSEESAGDARYWAPIYSSVLKKFINQLDMSKIDSLREYSVVEERLINNALYNPVKSYIFGAFTGALLTPIIVNLFTLAALRFKTPTLLNLIFAGAGGYLGSQSGVSASIRPTLEPILALPEESKLRQRVIDIFEEDQNAIVSPLYQLYALKHPQ